MAFCSNCGAEVYGKFCSNCGNNCGNEQDLVKSQASKQNENIEKTIADLYTLRAGISCAVQEKERYEKTKKTLANEVSITQSKLIAQRDMVESNRNKYENNKDIIENHKATESDYKLKERYIKQSKTEDVLQKIFNVSGYISFALALASFIMIWVVVYNIPETDVSRYWGGIGGCVGGLAIFITLGILGLVKGSDIGIKHYAKRRELYDKISDYERAIKASSLMEEEYNLSKQAIPELEEKDNKAKLKLKTEPVKYLITSNGIYDILVKEYSKLIDTRDWENLDLVIFYFETGRAKSMQEALQLVDRQRQNDRIVEAINEASYQVCNTINAGIEHIQNVVVGCAKVLSTQLDEIASQQKALGREISNLQISASTMQNALKAKSNVSSNQLAEDIHQMRIYAENEAIRRRNS